MKKYLTGAWKFEVIKGEEWLENNGEASVCLNEEDAWKGSRSMLTVRPLYSLCKEKKAKKINISLVSINNMN